MVTNTGDSLFDTLAQLLRFLHPKQDVEPLLEQLNAHFGSAHALLAADAYVLTELGMDRRDALLFSRLRALERRLNAPPKAAQITGLYSACRLLAQLYRGLERERFYLLCLDRQGRGIHTLLLQEGTADGTLFDLRNLLPQVVRLQPSAVIMSHNHPGGMAAPSAQDLGCTSRCLRALGTIGIPLLDHIIIAGTQAVSLRDNGFIPEEIWRAQAEGHKLNRNWTMGGET